MPLIVALESPLIVMSTFTPSAPEVEAGDADDDDVRAPVDDGVDAPDRASHQFPGGKGDVRD